MRPRGRIENEVLALLRQETGTLDAVELASRVYHIDPVPKAAYVAVRRALRSLARKGLVCAGSRQHANGDGTQTIPSIRISSLPATGPSPV